MLNPDLVAAYRFRKELVTLRAAFYREGNQSSSVRAIRGVAALTCLEQAREDVAAGKKRYPHIGKPYPAVTWQPAEPIGNLPFPEYAKTGKAYVENPGNAGLRHVGDVNADSRSNGLWNTRGKPCGWYADNESGASNGTVYGVVFQLPGRNGKARFVAGYRFSEHDGEGVTVDFATIYEEPRGDWYNSVCDCDSARDAARVADSLAECAAEEEREYSAAWSAGTAWLERKQEVADLRKEALEILKERRQARADAVTYPTLCQVVRSRVDSILEEISQKRDQMRTLANGDSLGEWLPGFWTGDKRLRDAFNEGAGETVLA